MNPFRTYISETIDVTKTVGVECGVYVPKQIHSKSFYFDEL
jgi:hypothetical protein